jgi:hypothetical protein
VNQPALTQLSIDGSWLTPGVVYTMELQYAILAGQPEEANLNGIEFQGLATYRKLTMINIMVESAPVEGSQLGADFTNDGKSDIVWQSASSGQVIIWHMNGTTATSYNFLTTQPDYQVRGSGDFSNDGKSDIVWQSASSGQVIIWNMNGSSASSYNFLTTQPDYQVVNN